ncbi:MAG: response regulator [Candidatus Methanosuratus sp.]|nr:response regulator [Candidatus Methanosuratincola sp.]
MGAQEYSVLLVDDDLDLLETMKAILERRGYRVETSQTGEDALEKIKEKYFDVIVLDLVLPGISGIELLSRLETNRIPRVRKIILTGHSTLENAVQALNLGADAYLIKPVMPEDLVKAIADQIDKQQQEILLIQEKIRYFVERNSEEKIRRISEEKYL